MLLAALEKFKYQATNRLLLAVLEEYGDSGTAQKKDVKKAPVKMLPSTLSKHFMYVYYKHFCLNNHGKQICKLKIRIEYQWLHGVKLPVHVLTIKYFVSR